MPTRHSLPSGNWVELRDWRELRRGDKKRAMSGITDFEHAIASGYELTDGLLTILVTNWSYDLPVPSTSRQSLDLLPIEDDSPLMELMQEPMRALFPKAADPADEAQRGDEASPTGPSAG